MKSDSMYSSYGKELFDKNYTELYMKKQLEKFQNRFKNHWKNKIEYAFELLEIAQLKTGASALDLGTSIGTYAYELSQKGYKAYGIDLDSKSIAMAKELAVESCLDIDYKVGDISDSSQYKEETFDLITAMDIVEHLPKRTFEASIHAAYYWLRPGGYILCHTVPTRYDILFHKSLFWVWLMPFAWLKEDLFKAVVQKAYGCYNLIHRLVKGETYDSKISRSVHCNLQTKESLNEVMTKAGFKAVRLDLTTTEKRFLKSFKTKIFGNKEYYKKDMFALYIK